MRSGEWPNFSRGCEHCRDQEQIGGVSDRLNWLQNNDNARYVPQELLKNPNEVVIQPTQVSMHFSNKCNMKCVYCGPNLSTAWVKELREAGDLEVVEYSQLNEKKYQQRVSLFWKWMDENYRNLKAFDILGGEPWIHGETWECIDWMIQHPNLELDFEIYSNMQVKPEIFKKKTQKLEELAEAVREVVVTVSIDCWGPASEFIRFGHDMETFEKNMDFLVYETKKVIPTINMTVSSLSIPYIPELQRKILKWCEHKYIPVNFNKCIDPHIFDPSIMPYRIYQDSIQEILALNDQIYKQRAYKQYPKTIFKEIETSGEDIPAQKLLCKTLDSLDQRRGTNWRSTFPWLASLSQNLDYSPGDADVSAPAEKFGM